MAIARKPITQVPDRSAADKESLVESLIAKGGSVAGPEATTAKSKETSSFTFRIPSQLLTELDEHRNNQPYKITRQQWLLSAVVRQLEHEKSSARKGATNHE